MVNDYSMYQGFSTEGAKEVNITSNQNIEFEYNKTDGCNQMKGAVLAPVYECPTERQVHRQIVHEVPHVCPVNTKIINHHIYRHTYSPCYTCYEENVISNVCEGSCCKF